MKKTMNKLFGILGIGLGWGIIWVITFTLLSMILKILRPQDFDPGENFLLIVRTGFIIGIGAGILYAIILLLSEKGKDVINLSKIRLGIWGILAAAICTLISTADNSMMIILCPLGAICAITVLIVAKKEDRNNLKSKKISRIITNPLRMVL